MSCRPSLRALLGALTCLLAGLGCAPGCSRAEPRPDGGAPATAVPRDDGGLRAAFAPLDALRFCDIDHRGPLLDLGTDAMAGRWGFELATPKGLVPTEHDGATWARVYDKELTLSFRLPAVTPVFVALRVIGRDARRVSVTLDGTPLGTEKLAAGAARIVSTRPTKLPVDAGLHRLAIAFGGTRGAGGEPFAEIDWVRIGVPDELTRTYGAPTLFDVITPGAELGNVPHRAFGMRAPGAIRCPVRVPAYGRLRVSVGMRGDGHATAALVVREDGREATVLERIEADGGTAARWQDLDVSLQPFAGRIVSLELHALQTTGTGRLMFGDPVLLVPDRQPPQLPAAKAAVLVVMSGLERADLPPWRGAASPHLPTLNQLAKTATVFMRHRASSTLAAAATATLLTGVGPRAHGLLDSGARLPKGVVTIADVARDTSVRAAMFTAVPTSFEPFGFASHWESFTQYPPNGEKPAAAPFGDAAAWLTDSSHEGTASPALLAVVHARGGHPPWDLTPPETANLPPPAYAGALRPRDAAESLASLEGRLNRLSEADLVRLGAMYHAALATEDAALGKLIVRLEESGRWDSTLLVVAGDVGSARPTLFADGLALDEELLAQPLYVHFPGGAHAGERVERASEAADVTHTVLRALGLAPMPEGGGHDLAALAAGFDRDAQHVAVAAIEDQYSARWGDLALVGKADGRPPRLCDLSLDATCAFDRTADRPIAAQALFARLVAADEHATAVPEREPLTLDAEAAAWLKIWGAYAY